MTDVSPWSLRRRRWARLTFTRHGVAFRVQVSCVVWDVNKWLQTPQSCFSGQASLLSNNQTSTSWWWRWRSETVAVVRYCHQRPRTCILFIRPCCVCVIVTSQQRSLTIDNECVTFKCCFCAGSVSRVGFLMLLLLYFSCCCSSAIRRLCAVLFHRLIIRFEL